MKETSINYIIADDDFVYREYTLQQLTQFPFLHCLAEAENAWQVTALMGEFQPDLLILDVEMPGLSGIQLAKSIKNLPFIIFISSHLNYASDAFEVDAVDYLVKPVNIERMIRAIEKVKILQEMKKQIAPPDAFKQADADSFFIKEKNMFIRIHYDEVVYIESLGDFVNIFLNSGEKKITLVTLKNLEQQLPAQAFIRISRTHMVNKSKVTAIDSTNVWMNKIILPIGKTYAESTTNHILSNNAIKRFI